MVGGRPFRCWRRVPASATATWSTVSMPSRTHVCNPAPARVAHGTAQDGAHYRDSGAMNTTTARSIAPMATGSGTGWKLVPPRAKSALSPALPPGRSLLPSHFHFPATSHDALPHPGGSPLRLPAGLMALLRAHPRTTRPRGHSIGRARLFPGAGAACHPPALPLRRRPPAAAAQPQAGPRRPRPCAVWPCAPHRPSRRPRHPRLPPWR